MVEIPIGFLRSSFLITGSSRAVTNFNTRKTRYLRTFFLTRVSSSTFPVNTSSSTTQLNIVLLKMQNPNNKRPLSDNSDKGGSASKKQNVRQMSLLSMFKKTTPATTPDCADKKNDTTGKSPSTVDALEVSLNNQKRETKDLFKDLNEEMKTMLELELDTMQYDWAKVLKPELTKPYFLEVINNK